MIHNVTEDKKEMTTMGKLFVLIEKVKELRSGVKELEAIDKSFLGQNVNEKFREALKKVENDICWRLKKMKNGEGEQVDTHIESFVAVMDAIGKEKEIRMKASELSKMRQDGFFKGDLTVGEFESTMKEIELSICKGLEAKSKVGIELEAKSKVGIEEELKKQKKTDA
jgi:hypothetical protein